MPSFFYCILLGVCNLIEKNIFLLLFFIRQACFLIPKDLSLRFHVNILLDLNECEVSNGGCDHQYENTVGSRVCQCYKGFILNSEGKTCSGKWPAKLLHF